MKITKRPASERGWGVGDYTISNPGLERYYRDVCSGKIDIGLKVRFTFHKDNVAQDIMAGEPVTDFLKRRESVEHLTRVRKLF